MTRRIAASIFAAALLVTGFATVDSAQATATIAQFSVAPSTTLAGGHPNLRVSTTFTEPTGVKDIALHLPPGLTANPAAIPFCARKRLLADLCSPSDKAGSIMIVAVAYGFDFPITRDIYNVRPMPGERLRLGVPILGSYSHPGIAAELPVDQRPVDGGLDMAVTGLPDQIGSIPIRMRELGLSLKGVPRKRLKRKIRRRPFLTNPLSCTSATSVLNVTLHDPAATALRASSVFTPSGCAG